MYSYFDLMPASVDTIPHLLLPFFNLSRFHVNELTCGQHGLRSWLGHLLVAKLCETLAVHNANMPNLFLWVKLEVERLSSLDSTKLSIYRVLDKREGRRNQKSLQAP